MPTVHHLFARALLLLSILFLTATACGPRDAHPGRSLGIERYPSARDLYVLAETYRAKYKLPALGIGIVHQGRVVGLGHRDE